MDDNQTYSGLSPNSQSEEARSESNGASRSFLRQRLNPCQSTVPTHGLFAAKDRGQPQECEEINWAEDGKWQYD